MSDEGYLQIKVRDLKEEVEKLEARYNQDKLLIQNLLAEMDAKKTKLKEQRDREEHLTNTLLEVTKFHDEHYKNMQNRVLGELRLLFVDFKKQCRYDIADYMTSAILLQKYLMKKGMFNPNEFVEYIDKNHDETREQMLKEGTLECWDTIKVGFGDKLKEMK